MLFSLYREDRRVDVAASTSSFVDEFPDLISDDLMEFMCLTGDQRTAFEGFVSLLTQFPDPEMRKRILTGEHPPTPNFSLPLLRVAHKSPPPPRVVSEKPLPPRAICCPLLVADLVVARMLACNPQYRTQEKRKYGMCAPPHDPLPPPCLCSGAERGGGAAVVGHVFGPVARPSRRANRGGGSGLE